MNTTNINNFPLLIFKKHLKNGILELHTAEKLKKIKILKIYPINQGVSFA